MSEDTQKPEVPVAASEESSTGVSKDQPTMEHLLHENKNLDLKRRRILKPYMKRHPLKMSHFLQLLKNGNLMSQIVENPFLDQYLKMREKD